MSALKSGISIQDLDPQIRPQDDLFRHYNGKWIREYEMPADRASDGIFRKLHLCNAPSGAQQASDDVGDLFSQCGRAGRLPVGARHHWYVRMRMRDVR